MLLKNGLIFGEDGKFHRADLACGERITAIGKIEGKADLDVNGKYIIPGLVDIHSHGAVGADASDGSREGLKKMSRYYARGGVTSWCATTMSLPEEKLSAAVRTICGSAVPGARCVGIHLEGPFLSREKRGAQKDTYLRDPDIGLFDRLMEESGGQIRLVTMAPELPGAEAFIRYVSRYCTVSAGHSAADYETAARAFAAGASHVTHLFNGMNGIHHRAPGLIGAAQDAGATAEIICDGLHIHPSAVRMAAQIFPGRLALISDSMRCAGMPDGQYELGGQQVTVTEGRAELADGTLAGSSIHLMEALKNAVRFGLSLETAVQAATALPAGIIGMEREIGCLAVGRRADLLVLDRDLDPELVVIGGEIYREEDC